jgi:hypothetical protein
MVGAESMSEKFVGYFRFLEACVVGGCPICRCVRDESRSHLDALLYEHVTDPDTRRELRASWGFCNWHTWMLLEIENSLFGSAILYEDLVRLVVKRIRRFADRPRSRRPGSWLGLFGGRRRLPIIVELFRRRQVCPLCASAAETTDRYLTTAVRFVSEADFLAAYGQSDGLCAPHMLRALEIEAGSPGARELLDRTLAKWTKLREDVDGFVRKHDYRNREAFTDAETASYMRAFEMMAGAKGLFGNDFGAARDDEPRRRRRRVGSRPQAGLGIGEQRAEREGSR